MISNKIFDFVFTMALRTATDRGVYKGNKNNILDNENAKRILKEYVNNIMDGKNYDFYFTADKLEKEIQKNNPDFCFGHVQKLINITCKYFYITVYYNSSLRKKFNNCHCPLDRKMKKKIIIELKKHEKNLKSDIGYEYIDIKRLFKNAWSKMQNNNIEQYELYQKCINYLAEKSNVSPLEYDYIMW